jgi:hypothetical protein
MVNEAFLQQLLELGLAFPAAISNPLHAGAVDAQDVLGKGIAGGMALLAGIEMYPHLHQACL